MSGYENNSIFWVETEKIGPNPFQPRREFEPGSLDDLADSIRQYGVLQPLVVTRKEEQNENGGYNVFYELIAGERRLRASRIAGLKQVPVIIRKETNNKIKLELAIIENLQREDLNPVDRALAFEQLYKEFNLTHAEIGKRMGKSRVYVSNSLRLLALPENIKQGLMNGNITEGHTRPLLMLADKPEEQQTLFKEIMTKNMSVRESEKIARSIAQDRVRKKEFIVDPRIRKFEKKLSENLGTRVQIAQGEKGGKITIDYFTLKDLEGILKAMNKVEYTHNSNMMDRYISEQEQKHVKKELSNSSPLDFQDTQSLEPKQNQREKSKIIPEQNNYQAAHNSDSLIVIDKIEPLQQVPRSEGQEGQFSLKSDKPIVQTTQFRFSQEQAKKVNDFVNPSFFKSNKSRNRSTVHSISDNINKPDQDTIPGGLNRGDSSLVVGNRQNFPHISGFDVKANQPNQGQQYNFSEKNSSKKYFQQNSEDDVNSYE